MPITLDTTSSQTQRKTYRKDTGLPHVEVTISINDANNAGMQIRISAATGAAELVQVLQFIANKMKTDFGA